MQEFSQVTGTQSSTWDLWRGLRDNQKLSARWEFSFQPSRSYQEQPFGRSLAQVERYQVGTCKWRPLFLAPNQFHRFSETLQKSWYIILSLKEAEAQKWQVWGLRQTASQMAKLSVFPLLVIMPPLLCMLCLLHLPKASDHENRKVLSARLFKSRFRCKRRQRRSGSSHH